MTQRRCEEVGGSRDSRCTLYWETTDEGHIVLTHSAKQVGYPASSSRTHSP
jgi:hypothetical protein